MGARIGVMGDMVVASMAVPRQRRRDRSMVSCGEA
jgi:hypothetical protein